MKKVLWALSILFAILIGTMPFIILFKGVKFGIETTKDASLYTNLFWKNSFYIHVILGGIPLLIGWLQFNTSLRKKYLNTHRMIGKIYVVLFLITAISGLFISFYATGGIIPALGFGTLSLIAFCVTLKAYLYIRKGDIINHKKMMMYSYACCFGAVTFRLWQMVLMYIISDQDTAYKIASWIGWIPNLFVVFLIIKANQNSPIRLISINNGN